MNAYTPVLQQKKAYTLGFQLKNLTDAHATMVTRGKSQFQTAQCKFARQDKATKIHTNIKNYVTQFKTEAKQGGYLVREKATKASLTGGASVNDLKNKVASRRASRSTTRSKEVVCL